VIFLTNFNELPPLTLSNHASSKIVQFLHSLASKMLILKINEKTIATKVEQHFYTKRFYLTYRKQQLKRTLKNNNYL
jgi:hypothetical protein